MYKSVIRNFQILNQEIFERYMAFCEDFIDFTNAPKYILKNSALATWNLIEKGCITLIFNKHIQHREMLTITASIIAFSETYFQPLPIVNISYAQNKMSDLMKE